MKKHLRLTAALLSLLLFASCSAPGVDPAPPAVPEPPPEDQLYSVYSNGRRYIFDKEGALLPEEEAYAILYDGATGEARYRVRTRSVDTGEDDEWGNPVVQKSSALYDHKGKLLYDWLPVDYAEGVGGMVIRQDPRGMYQDIWPEELDSYQSALWDPRTGETVVEGAGGLSDLGDGHFLVRDAAGRAMGVIDQAGKKLSGFPAPADYYYPSVGHGLIVADTNNPYSYESSGKPRSLLMDQSFGVLLERERINISFVGLRGPYILTGEGDERAILSLPDLQELFAYNEKETTLDYYDGERMILRSGDHETNFRCVLCDSRGNPLSEEYERIFPENEFWDSEVTSERFLAQGKDAAYLLDRDGKVLHSVQIPGLGNISSLDGGYYAYDAAADYIRNTGLLGPELQVIPTEAYSYIGRLRTWHGSGSTVYDLLQCGRQIKNIHRYDLLDLSGKVVVKNLSSVGDVGPNRVAVARGFSVGLMDWEGNWISRHSIYQELKNDD